MTSTPRASYTSFTNSAYTKKSFICFTSPTKRCFQTPTRVSSATNCFNTPGSANIHIATPPTPESSGGLPLPSHKFQKSLNRAIYRCNLPAHLAEAVERLSWVAEQVLTHPLNFIALTLNSVETHCTKLQMRQLEILRNSYVKSAVAHLESQLSTSTLSVALPQATTALLEQFKKLAVDIKRQNETNTFVSSKTPLKITECNDSTGTPRIKTKSLQNLLYDENISKSTSVTKQLTAHCETAKLLSKNIIHPILSCEQLKEDILKPKPIRRNSIQNLKNLLTTTIPPEHYHIYFSDDIIQSIAKTHTLKFTAAVSRKAQQYLGEIWKLMQKHGVGQHFFDMIKVESIESQNLNFKWLSKSPIFIKKKLQSERNIGALELLGPRGNRKGRYISRKSVTAKAKRTKEKNLKKLQAKKIDGELETQKDNGTSET